MKYRIKDYPEIRAKVEAMSVDELLTSVICPDYPLGVKTPARNTYGYCSATNRYVIEQLFGDGRQ